jgi:hypothetical protein
MHRFMNLWMAFNAWATCVTEKDRDSDMIKALVADGRMRNAFDRLYAREPEFTGLVEEFVSWWPIYDARSFRKKARTEDVPQIFERADIHRLAQRWGIKSTPEHWETGNRVQWAEVLGTIYKVRCNLFHGQKGMNNEADVALVDITHRLLERYINLSGCYGWQ